MRLEWKWKETTGEVYRAIYNAHHEDFSVFETASYEDCWLTSWGFKDADHPIIKSVRTQGDYLGEELSSWGEWFKMYKYEWKYYILRKVVVDE